MDRVLTKAPSNIALIKYMGKQDFEKNLPANPSLSMTLNHFCTYAEASQIERAPKTLTDCRVHWLAEPPRGVEPEPGYPWQLSEKSATAVQKVERFAQKVSQRLPALFSRHDLPFQPVSSFELRTANTFPAAAGLASSASAFAAMTLTFSLMMCAESSRFRELFESSQEFRRDLAALSREGSGSSCRSFLGPWVSWENAQVGSVESSLEAFCDLVLVVKTSPKLVSSSEAHRRVLTSPSWPHRVATASARWELLKSALRKADVSSVATLSWQDSWDMHHLFHTSEPPFTYWQTETFEVLRWFVTEKSSLPTTPVVTLDAGPNIHVLVPKRARDAWKTRLSQVFPKLSILEDEQGQGAEILHG